MVKTVSDVSIREIAGKEPGGGVGAKRITIENHWNDDKMVVVTFPGFQTMSFLAGDLLAAIHSAMNVNRYG